MSEKKGVERRRHARVNKRYTVRFGLGDLPHSGYAQDFSASGLHLRSGITFPPRTVLHLQIEYPGKTLLVRGMVRWSKGAPSTSKRNFGGGMGVEFVAADLAKIPLGILQPISDSAESKPASSAPPGPANPASSGHPPEANEKDFREEATRHRQVSTRSGKTFEVLQTEYRGAIHVRIYQLPRTDGSAEALFRQAYWQKEEAEAAIKAFLRDR
jgi:PilZ domain-containing protein